MAEDKDVQRQEALLDSADEIDQVTGESSEVSDGDKLARYRREVKWGLMLLGALLVALICTTGYRIYSMRQKAEARNQVGASDASRAKEAPEASDGDTSSEPSSEADPWANMDRMGVLGPTDEKESRQTSGTAGSGGAAAFASDDDDYRQSYSQSSAPSFPDPQAPFPDGPSSPEQNRDTGGYADTGRADSQGDGRSFEVPSFGGSTGSRYLDYQPGDRYAMTPPEFDASAETPRSGLGQSSQYGAGDSVGEALAEGGGQTESPRYAGSESFGSANTNQQHSGGDFASGSARYERYAEAPSIASADPIVPIAPPQATTAGSGTFAGQSSRGEPRMGTNLDGQQEGSRADDGSGEDRYVSAEPAARVAAQPQGGFTRSPEINVPPLTGIPAQGASRSTPTRSYVVQPGDTLFDIARRELGLASRWPEIYELNRERLGKRLEQLAPGTSLLLPDGSRSASRSRDAWPFE